jgi:transcriptional regulator with XRE-family HTH domain
MKILLEAKNKLNLTFDEIAVAIHDGNTRGSIASIMHGKRSASIGLLIKIGDFLEVPEEEILKEYMTKYKEKLTQKIAENSKHPETIYSNCVKLSH